MILTVLAFQLAIWIVHIVGFPGITVDEFWTALLLVIVILVTQSVAGAIWATADDFGFHHSVRTGLHFRHRHAAVTSQEPGILFLEIDGLARPILDEALAAGYMPTLKRWIESGTHTISNWETDLSSQTSASQAGILLGSNEGIPAFRWWSKGLGKPEVSSAYGTAHALEARLSTGDGLLVGGASRWNIFTGDATDALATFSTIGGRDLSRSAGAIVYLSNPVALSRSLGLYIAEVFRERWQARQQIRKDVQPRGHRGWKYAFIRGATNVSMQEMNIFMLISDMIRGAPVVYSTFFAYDEVAHHSGPRSTDSLKVLRKLDDGFLALEETLPVAKRPYRFVVLSDHGQSYGATFLQRYGKTLQVLVDELAGSRRTVHAFTGASEEMGNITAAVDAVLTTESRTAKAAKRAVGDRLTEATTESAEQVSSGIGTSTPSEYAPSDIVVMASGNLGLISFTNTPQRITLEQLDDEIPGFIDGLASHPGISFVMIHSAKEDEAVAIGPGGRHYLATDRVEGVDPLAIFPETSRQHLLRTDGFANVPDILVMSMFNPETGETAAFEELIGNHGGLGGDQQRPFVLHPVELPFPAEPVIGAAALHHVFKDWVRALHSVG